MQEIIYNKLLTPNERLILFCLADHRDKTLKIKEIAEIIGCSNNTATLSIQGLLFHDLVECSGKTSSKIVKIKEVN